MPTSIYRWRYYTKSVPRQTVDRGRRGMPRSNIRWPTGHSEGAATGGAHGNRWGKSNAALHRQTLRQKSSAADEQRSAAKLPRPKMRKTVLPRSECLSLRRATPKTSEGRDRQVCLCCRSPSAKPRDRRCTGDIQLANPISVSCVPRDQ